MMDRYHLDRQMELRAVGMIRAGLSQKEAAEVLQTNKCIINRLC